MEGDKPRWLPLESNPSVLTEYIRKIGVSSEWAFRDCLGLSPDLLLMVPRPCFALLFLFPFKNVKKETSGGQQEDPGLGEAKQDKPVSSEVPQGGENQQGGSSNIYFVRQHVKNACGTIAVLHALANNAQALGISSGPLYEFLVNTAHLSAEEKGHSLGKSTAMTRFHEETSKKGSTNSKDYLKTNFHFICFTVIDGFLYELDGSRPSPINHGRSTQDSMLFDAAQIIQTNFIQQNPTELFFSLITLGPALGDELQEKEMLEKTISREEVRPEVLQQLLDLGFPREASIAALQATNNRSQAAIEALLSGSTPAPPPRTDTNPEHISAITSMGFTNEQALQALHQCGDLELAINYLLSQ